MAFLCREAPLVVPSDELRCIANRWQVRCDRDKELHWVIYTWRIIMKMRDHVGRIWLQEQDLLRQDGLDLENLVKHGRVYTLPPNVVQAKLHPAHERASRGLACEKTHRTTSDRF